MNDDGTTEEILESIDTPPQFQEELRVFWDAMIRPTHELNVGHLPLWVLLPLLQRDQIKMQILKKKNAQLQLEPSFSLFKTHISYGEMANDIIRTVFLWAQLQYKLLKDLGLSV